MAVEGSCRNVLERQRRLRGAVRAAVWSGSCASVASTLALAVCGRLEERSAAGPVNGPSQWLWGEREAYTRAFTVRHTVVGYAIHHSASIFWALLYEGAFQTRRPNAPLGVLAAAATTAGIAYVIDYHLTPRRFRPGFKKHLGPASLVAVYSAFALGLAGGTLSGRAHRRTAPNGRS